MTVSLGGPRCPEGGTTRRSLAAIALACVLAVPWLPAVAAEQRWALVVGNAAYKDAPLVNPANDAKAMAQALQAAGFTVLLRTDVGHRAMLDAVREFGNRLRQGGVGVFYYAGHGMQIKGRNYLIPIGANIQREDEVAYEALDAQAVLDKMETAANGTNLMILDACRNNPFARSFRSSVAGLAPMDAPVGTLVAFATAPGGVASDGQGSNGLYTQYLLDAMRKPGAKVEDVFKQVRAGVRRESQGKQIPWEATSLEGDLYFFPQAAAPPSLPTVASTAPKPRVVPEPAMPAAPRDQTAHDKRTAELEAELKRPPAAPANARVAAKPASNAQGYTVGDRWNYQLIDKWKGEVIRNFTLRVGSMQADGSWATPEGKNQYDPYGRATRWTTVNGTPQHSTPVIPRWWPGMKVGDKLPATIELSGEFAAGQPWTNRLDYVAEVRALESVKVPAGEFKAYRVEVTGNFTAVGRPGRGRTKLTYWYAPELHTLVAYEQESSWNGRPDQREREELTSFSLINPPPAR